MTTYVKSMKSNINTCNIHKALDDNLAFF